VSKYLVMASGWIGADGIVEAESAEAAGRKWVEGKASPTPGEITIYPLGPAERFTVKIEQVSVKPTAQPAAKPRRGFVEPPPACTCGAFKTWSECSPTCPTRAERAQRPQQGTVAAAMDKAHEEVKRGGGGAFSEFVKGSMPATDPPGVVRTRSSTGPAAAREWKNPNVKPGELAAAVGAAREEFVKAVAGACTCDAWFAPPEARRKHSEGCAAAAPVAPLDSASGDSPGAT